MKLSSKRKDQPYCNSFIANHKATKTTQIRANHIYKDTQQKCISQDA